MLTPFLICLLERLMKKITKIDTFQANKYYRMFITWTNQKIRRTFVHRNMFDFKHIKPFDKSYMDNPGPMVVFATPGMLHAGLSLAIFKKWASNANNMVSPLMFRFFFIIDLGRKEKDDIFFPFFLENELVISRHSICPKIRVKQF